MNKKVKNVAVPVLRDSTVLVVDILGYKELARSCGSDAAKLNRLLGRLHAALKRAGSFMGRPNPDAPSMLDAFENPFSTSAYTDNFVVTWPNINEMSIGNLMLMAGSFQMAMVDDGFFVRGGLAIGPSFQDEFAVFGPAFFEAYEIEAQRAVVPRVVLSEPAFLQAVAHTRFYAELAESPQTSEILIDLADDSAFVNYLVCGALDDEVLYSSLYVERIKAHRQHVVAALSKNATKLAVAEKYLWCAAYHNYVITNWFLDKPDLAVQGDEIPAALAQQWSIMCSQPRFVTLAEVMPLKVRPDAEEPPHDPHPTR